MDKLGDVLDPIRKQVIDLKDELAHARFRYDALEILMENVADAKLRAAAQEIFAVASEQLNAVDRMLDDHYRELSAIDRRLEAFDTSQKRDKSSSV